MPGIKDVAKRAGTGVGTVSRVLNDSGYVSEEKREKVLKAMQELNYTPNELARNLFHKKTGIVAVLVPDIAHPFFAEFVKYVEEEMYLKGYKVMVCNTEKEKNCESEYLDMLKRNIVDGIITGVHSLAIEQYINIDRPIVALDRYLSENIPVVSVNHKQGGKLAAEKLLADNCKFVIQFCGSKSVNSPSHERHTVFEEILKQNGVQVYSCELGWNKFSTEYFQQVVHDVFVSYPKVDGIFGTDLLAAEFLKEALKANKKVPNDIKIVAYDGTYVVDLIYPTLTAVVQPLNLLAKETTELLISCIEGNRYKNKEVVLEVELKEGGTTI